MSKAEAFKPAVRDDDDDDVSGMAGARSVSLEGFFEQESDPKRREDAAAAAHAAIVASVVEDMAYWRRISSTVCGDEVPAGAMDKVADSQFRDFAQHWVRTGHGVDILTDAKKLKAEQDVRDGRLDRNLDRKATKAAGAKKRATVIVAAAAAASSSSDAQARTAAQRQAQAARSAAQAEALAAASATMFVELDPATEPKVDFGKVLELLDSLETRFFKDMPDVVEKLIELAPAERELLMSAYAHMVWHFHAPQFKRRYGYSASDHAQPELKPGAPVPAYFANVKDGSIFRRKLLSIAGMRNLIIYGPAIYAQMKSKHFDGRIEAYAEGTGLKLCKQMTGTVVDMDTTVLRANDPATLNAINASNKHKKCGPQYANSEQFASSPQAKEIAIGCAVPMLQHFAERLKLSAQQITERKVDWKSLSPAGAIPVAQNNADRGNFPVWQYVNAGQNSFHVNVVSFDELNLTLFLAPFHALRHWAFTFCVFKGPELEKMVDAAFADMIDDACLNYKARAIESYGERLAHMGTIVDILQKLQQENQKEFTAQFFEADDDEQTNEKAKMWEFAKGKKGRETKTGRIRDITKEDVDKWVSDPSTKI